jgi:hypothetical protein
MTNLVKLNDKKFLGSYIETQQQQRIPDGLFFFTGVVLTVALPQIICAASGGAILTAALAGTVVAGSIWGGVKYRRGQPRMVSCVDSSSIPRGPIDESPRRKAA